MPRTDWFALIMSTAMPIIVAMGFVRLAGLSGWDWAPSEAWLYGLLALVPLEFVRAITLGVLGVAYAKGSGPRQAIMQFLSTMATLAVLGLVWALFEVGPTDTFGMLTSLTFYKVAALPVLILLIECAVGIATFRGDPKSQGMRLEAISADSFDWLSLAAKRIPIVILPVYGVLILLRSMGFHALDWAPYPASDLARSIGLYYLAGYFLVKAVIVGHVHTARFAATGRRLLATGWAQWLLGERG